MQRFAPYLLDRLMDDSPDSRLEALAPTLSLEQLKDTVARDIEALLNTRCAIGADEMADFLHARQSLLRFGLDDFSSRSLASVADRDFICRAIERAIADQEPRLQEAHVSLDAEATPGQRLRFSIRALLQIHPSAEPVSFDAVLQTGSQHYVVSSAARTTSAPPAPR